VAIGEPAEPGEQLVRVRERGEPDDQIDDWGPGDEPVADRWRPGDV